MFAFLNKILGGETVDIKALLQRGAVIIDVRTPGEFQAGHTKGAINMPLDSIGSQVGRIKAMNKPVITCCRSGARSGSAASMLKAQGIEAHNGGPWGDVQAAL